MIKFDDVRGVWVDEREDGTYTIDGGYQVANTIKQITALRDAIKRFVTAWREVRGILEDWKIWGMLPPQLLAILPDGGDYDSAQVASDADAQAAGLESQAQLYAAVGSLMVIGNIGASDVKNITRAMTK